MLSPAAPPSRRALALGVLAAALASAAVAAAFACASVHGLFRPDGFDYAQIARELAEGRGFSSRQAIYALHLEWLRTHGLLGADWPNLHRFPLPSLAIAAAFRLLGEGTAAVVAYGVAFHAATGALLFGWAWRALGLVPALAVLGLFGVNGALLETAVSGLSEPPAIFFTSLALFLVWTARGVPRAGPWILAGGALGLAGLSRTNTLLLAPLALAALVHGDRRARRDPAGRRALAVRSAGFGLALLAVLAPWWLRNAWLTGDPFFSLHAYFLVPSGSEPDVLKWDLSERWVREFVPPLVWAREHPGAVLAKWLRQLAALARSLPTFAATWGVLPVAALALRRRLGRDLQTTAWLVVAGFALNALAVSFADFAFDKYHFHFLPGAMLLAVAVVWHGADRLRPPSRVLVPILAVLAMADLPGSVGAARMVSARAAQIDHGAMHWIARHTGEDAVVLSDQSYAIAWETRRRSVRMHYTRLPDGSRILGALALSDAYLPIDGIYLSREFLRDPGARAILERTLARQPRFREAFPTLHRFPDGALWFARRPEARQDSARFHTRLPSRASLQNSFVP